MIRIFLHSSSVRCYTEGGWTGDKTKQQVLEEDRDATLKELEPLKLPGDLAGYTGNVMYPNEESAVWDVDGECVFCVWRSQHILNSYFSSCECCMQGIESNKKLTIMLLM